MSKRNKGPRRSVQRREVWRTLKRRINGHSRGVPFHDDDDMGGEYDADDIHKGGSRDTHDRHEDGTHTDDNHDAGGTDDGTYDEDNADKSVCFEPLKNPP